LSAPPAWSKLRLASDAGSHRGRLLATQSRERAVSAARFSPPPPRYSSRPRCSCRFFLRADECCSCVARHCVCSRRIAVSSTTGDRSMNTKLLSAAVASALLAVSSIAIAQGASSGGTGGGDSAGTSGSGASSDTSGSASGMSSGSTGSSTKDPSSGISGSSGSSSDSQDTNTSGSAGAGSSGAGTPDTGSSAAGSSDTVRRVPARQANSPPTPIPAARPAPVQDRRAK